MSTGRRFEFGANWSRFLSTLTDSQIDDAALSLKEFLGVDDLKGQRFLDIGSGSGLFSLAARRLGASVTSFDFDPQSVACTAELKDRNYPNDEEWRVERGSALDQAYIGSLGQFDVVYCWGVLHHTGAMWVGIENVLRCLGQNGKLFIALYNDQGWKSHAWWFIKLWYNRLPRIAKPTYVLAVTTFLRTGVALRYLIRGQPATAISSLRRVQGERGMSTRYDVTDWVGGFPYEFVAFETLVDYFRSRELSVLTARKNTSLGCHQLVLRRTACAG